MKNDVEIRDESRTPFTMFDNHVHDLYARRLGFQGWAVYTTLKRLAYGQTYRIGIKKIADIWGVHPRTIKRALADLRKMMLVKVTKTQTYSIVTILRIEQLNFSNDLIFDSYGEAKSDRKSTISEGTKMSPRKGQESPLGGDKNGPHNAKTLNKTLNKTVVGTSSRDSRRENQEIHDDAHKKAPLSSAERATMDYKAVRKQLDALEGASEGSSNFMTTKEWESRVLSKALHRAGVTWTRWKEIESHFEPLEGK